MVQVKLNITVEFVADNENIAKMRANGLRQAIKDALEESKIPGLSMGVTKGSTKVTINEGG